MLAPDRLQLRLLPDQVLGQLGGEGGQLGAERREGRRPPGAARLERGDRVGPRRELGPVGRVVGRVLLGDAREVVLQFI